MEKSNIETLRNALNPMPQTMPILTLFHNRRRARKYTTFLRLGRVLNLKGNNISRGQIEDFFKVMQSNGYGTIEKRRNKAHGFNWVYNLQTVADAVLGGASDGKTVSIQPSPKVKIPKLLVPSSSLKDVEKPVREVVLTGTKKNGVLTIRRGNIEMTIDLGMGKEQTDTAKDMAKDILQSLSL